MRFELREESEATRATLQALSDEFFAEAPRSISKELRTAVQASTKEVSEAIQASTLRQRKNVESRVTELSAKIRDDVKESTSRIRGDLSLPGDSLQTMNDVLISVRDSNEAGLVELLNQYSVRTKQLISAIEAQRVEVARIRGETDRIEATEYSLDRISRRNEKHPESIQRMLWDETREHEALQQLYEKYSIRGMMPPSGRWAMDARSLLHLLETVERCQPKTIVELGSGTSTVWLGYEAERLGSSVTSVDHLDEFANQTSRYLERHSLEAVARVSTAPLTEVSTSDGTFNWYDLREVDLPSSIDFLLVDGPPGSIGPRSRFPAVPLLRQRLAANAVVVLDDSTRSDEDEILQEWLYSLRGYVRIDTGISRIGILVPEHMAQ